MKFGDEIEKGLLYIGYSPSQKQHFAWNVEKQCVVIIVLN